MSDDINKAALALSGFIMLLDCKQSKDGGHAFDSAMAAGQAKIELDVCREDSKGKMH